MNLNDSELEQQLRLIRPRSASAELEGKIASALARREIAPAARIPTAAILRRDHPVATAWKRWLQGLGWALAGAAAAIAAIAFLNPAETSPKPSVAAVTTTEVFEPTESTEELVTAEDEGLVLDQDDEPVRQVRYYSLERHVWVDPHSGARMEFEIPREDVRFVAVAMQ